MGTNAERTTLAVLNALKRIDACSRNRKFKAKLQAYCDLTDIHLHLMTKSKERGIGLNPELGTFLEGVSVGHNDTYVSILLHKNNYMDDLIKMMGLSFDEACSQYILSFYHYGCGHTSLEYFMDELKTIVWEHNQFFLKQCPKLIADNLAAISLLPKKIINELNTNLLEDKKEYA
ncbi:hypothetical protein [Priestia megaterium]|uniref:hypothetical protein n=1 Tax=Priestia megaterium TaxID=1404 RepID=UPI0012D8552C|nr:hypothetical protein [Priestia megaterium]MUL34756.1 hypothetical protein [Priestia megaterium]